MKKLVFSLIASIIFLSCTEKNSGSGNKPEKISYDTTDVLALYKSAETGAVNEGIIKRVIFDTLSYFNTDINTKKKMWGKDTIYLITYTLAIDSAYAKLNNVPMRDSLGRQKYINPRIPTDKKYVRTGWDKIDSLVLLELRNQR